MTLIARHFLNFLCQVKHIYFQYLSFHHQLCYPENNSKEKTVVTVLKNVLKQNQTITALLNFFLTPQCSKEASICL